VGEYKGSRIRRVDPATGDVTTIDTGSFYPISFVMTDAAVWSVSVDGSLVRIDPATNTITDEIDIATELEGTGAQPFGMVGDGSTLSVVVCANASMDEFGVPRGCDWSL